MKVLNPNIHRTGRNAGHEIPGPLGSSRIDDCATPGPDRPLVGLARRPMHPCASILGLHRMPRSHAGASRLRADPIVGLGARMRVAHRLFQGISKVARRSFATLSLSIIGVWLLSGCAGTPTSSSLEVGNRPQMLMPGGIRDQVRGIAMGSARSKGWTIVKATDERVTMQRPLDPGSATALALGANTSTIPPVVEVDALFVEQADGVNVALGADLVSQPPGDNAPRRTDITESYRAELTQSLESLRATWSASRQRVAMATPPVMTQAERIAQGAPEDGAVPGPQSPAVQAWGDAVRESAAPPPAAVTEARPAPEPVAAPVPPPAPQAAPPVASSPPSATPVPAPVVEGSRTVAPAAASTRPLEPSLLPPLPPEPVTGNNDMLTLTRASGTGTWAYYAEQYARLRGCNVTDQGAILVETRSDGEIHRVPCLNSDSFLLKCSDGVCRGLQ